MVAITVAIAATVYVYVSGMMGTGQEAAPTITFLKEDKAAVNTLTVIAADPSDVSWGDIEILVNGTAVDHNETGAVTAGTIIDITDLVNASLLSGALDGTGISSKTGAYTISIRHVPTNTLIGTYDFTAAA